MTSPLRRGGPSGLRLVVPPSSESSPHASHAARSRAPLLDDSELLASLRAGDVSAAASLHDRVRPTIDRTVRRLLGSSDPDHDDVAQLAMIELVTTIDRYRGECSLDSWTSTLTARLVFKQIRKRRSERRFFAFEDDTTADVPAPLRPTHDLAVRDVLRRVEGLLSAVDDVKVWTFLLHDVWGYDLKEVAQITDVTVAAAQTRLVRGRAEVHARLEADPELAGLVAKELSS